MPGREGGAQPPQERSTEQREGRGSAVFYSIADKSVYALCDLVRGNMGWQMERQAAQRSSFMKGARATRRDG